MTHVLFITPYYPPEISAPAVRISETAMRLARRKYQVTVLTTFPNFPYGIVPTEYRGKRLQEDTIDGVKVVRVWSYASPNKGFFPRIIGQLSFGLLAALLGWKAVGRPDVIIVESPPLFDAFSGRFLAWLKGCPFIFTVADLWPEAAIQMGALRNTLFIRLAQWLEWSTYRRAALVWVVSEGIQRLLIQRGFPADKLFLLTNGVDTSLFRPMSKEEARAELGWDARFSVVYAGTHGLAQGLSTIVDAAERLSAQPDVHVYFVGEGAVKAELIAQVQEKALTNVSFLPSQAHERLPLLLAAADICLVPLRKVTLFATTLPVKMFEIMACGRPMILSADGQARVLAEQQAKAALCVEPENAQALATAILHLQAHPEVAEQLASNGRAYVVEHFDREKLASGLESRIVQLLGMQTPQEDTPAHEELAVPTLPEKTLL